MKVNVIGSEKQKRNTNDQISKDIFQGPISFLVHCPHLSSCFLSRLLYCPHRLNLIINLEGIEVIVGEDHLIQTWRLFIHRTMR